ncbi:hypothetical protein CRM22_003970 [Opisthorchis felineus]|uniref:Noggin n=1 Tax=Opisthorchis felineus TaxID=147828 RepID=A0A4S2M4R3_OPIFE|nr:hypothetical protein CRM22_003970 [Opisthorchis felineus]
MNITQYLIGFTVFTCCVVLFLDAQSMLYPTPHFARITTGNSPKKSPHPVATDADYSRKVSVRVSDVLTRQKAAAAASSYQISPSDIITQSFTRPGSSSGVASITQKESPLPMAQIVVRPQNSPPAGALVVPMANTHSVIKDDRSWPPENSQEFARVDVRVMGERIDSVALLHLRPSSNAESTRKLRKILGSDLQSQWMSVEPPPKDSERTSRSVVTMSMPQQDDRLLKAVGELNFTVLRSSPGTDMVVPVEMTHDQIELVKAWLVQRASCRLDYVWEDLGPLFWPRWIRRGICMNTMACSWPPGMLCRPSGSRQLKLLRWVCKNDSNPTDDDPQKRRRRHEYPFYYKRYKREGPLLRRRIPREERRSRRVRRLIRKLSLTANGYYCEWSRHEYVVSDQCACGCE